MQRGVEWVSDTRMARPALGVPSLAIAGLLAVVLPLSFVAAGTSVLSGDVATTRFVQGHLPGWLDPLIAAANLLGEAPFTIAIALIVAAGLFVKGHRRHAWIVAAAMLAQGVNVLLKLSFESPRPTDVLVQVSEQTTGFGFPSGHTMGATVLALSLFYVATTLMADGIRRRMVQAGLLLTPLIMGVSRVETGAHWPSDVLGAWLWGTLAFIAIATAFQRSWNGLSLPIPRPARTVAFGQLDRISEVRRGVSQ